MSNIEIDLKLLFKKLEGKRYCIIKLPDEFPTYRIGSDLDIFCYDIEDISKVILSFLQNVISSDLSIQLTNMSKQIYIDLMVNNEINFRFDLYGSLPIYENVLIKEAFFSSIIEDAKDMEQGSCVVKVPSLIDESILRYIEYQEWYAQRPDKIKHIKYLEEKIKNAEIDSNKLFDKLHFYVKIPMATEGRNVSSNGYIRYLSYLYKILKKVLAVIKSKGLKEALSLIYMKIFKVPDRGSVNPTPLGG
jgi:hypothetical protein